MSARKSPSKSKSPKKVVKKSRSKSSKKNKGPKPPKAPLAAIFRWTKETGGVKRVPM
jgi:hypothetical protein